MEQGILNPKVHLFGIQHSLFNIHALNAAEGSRDSCCPLKVLFGKRITERLSLSRI